jgi:hypothetical protein
LPAASAIVYPLINTLSSNIIPAQVVFIPAQCKSFSCRGR